MGRVVIPGFRKIETSGGGEGGTTNYNDLINKPSINNVPLSGNLNTVDLHLTDTTLTEEGVPAEAKTVGAKLEEHSTSLTALKEEIIKKANSSDIPTKVSDLQNDNKYQTDTDVATTLTPYATKTYVGEQISSADHLKREIVTEIPSSETADKNTIYMLKIESAIGNDKYREYLLIDGTVQCIGDTSVDLTDYAKKTEIPTELPANGGNSSTVNGHTVNSDVPANAKFTDTVYDDTEVKEDVALLKNTVNKYFINTNETIYIPLNTMLLIYETAFDMGAYVVRRETKDRMFIHALKENSKVNITLADNGNLKIINTASVGGDILTIIY